MSETVDLGLAEDVARSITRRVADSRASGEGLLGGEEGALLLLCCAAATYEDLHLDDHIADRLQTLSARYRGDRSAKGGIDVSLFFGLAGFGWVASVAELAEPSFFEEIDRAVIDSLAEPRPVGLMEGTTGLAVYALTRPADARDAIVEAYLAALRATAVSSEAGTFWPGRGEGTIAPANLGLAHGVPGAIAQLSRVVLSGGAHTEGALALLQDATRFLLAQRRGTAAWTFPAHAGLDEPARLGWCYGDLSVAFALLWSARAQGDDQLTRFAIDVAKRSIARTPRDGVVRDAALCHGASGIALMYWRLFRASGVEDFRQASEQWFARALAFECPPEISDFLSGQAGLALALLTRLYDLETWDEPLATNLPANSITHLV